MKKFILITIFLASSVSTQSKAQESYLCISEAIGGVSYDANKKRWEGTKFTNSNEKSLLTKKNGTWKYKDFGSSAESDCGKFNDFGAIRCNILFGEFIFNFKTKRFTKSYLVGYVNGDDNNENTPAVMIGSCSQL